MEIKLIDPQQIQRDTSLFQFRTKEFNAERVDFLVENWDEGSLDPLDVWDNEGVLALLAGHHRLEAALRRKEKLIPCRVHTISLAQARTKALLSNSNRLEYTAFEKSGCIEYLLQQDGLTMVEAGRVMNLHPAMTKKFYTLRHLKNTEWETQSEAMNLLPLAFEVGLFLEQFALKKTELDSLFALVVKHQLSAAQLQQLLRDVKRYRSPSATGKQTSLFDLTNTELANRVVGSIKQRSALNDLATYTWFLYELVQAETDYQVPDDIKLPLSTKLRELYAFCIGSENKEETPRRATKQGRKLNAKLELPKND